jgi:2'-5' RNA ligase
MLSADRTPELREIYDDLWREGRAALSGGTVDVDPLPVDGGSRWGISAVLRPMTWSDALVRRASAIATLAGPRTVVYEPANLHLTVQQFEGHRVDVRADDRALRDQSAALVAITREIAPMTVEFRGLTASSGGVLVQGWPLFDLQALRERLHRELETSGSPVWGPEASSSALRTSAHATLAMFGGSVESPHDLRDDIEAHRESDFGTIAFDELWLVGYARTVRSVTLIEYGRFPFGGRAGSPR